jgi:hypothetical protein
MEGDGTRRSERLPAGPAAGTASGAAGTAGGAGCLRLGHNSRPHDVPHRFESKKSPHLMLGQPARPAALVA